MPLCPRRRLEELIWLGIPERPVIGHVIAAEFVDECHINDEVGISADVGALDDQVTLSGLAILFHSVSCWARALQASFTWLLLGVSYWGKGTAGFGA